VSEEEVVATEPNKEVTTESTGTYAGQRADVIIERWVDVRPDPDNEDGVLAEPMVMVEVKYDGFDGIAAFPYQDVDHVLSDLTGNHYQRQILTERRDQAGVDMPEEEFAAAITSVEADAEAIIRTAFNR
jgi:hypothetical protein